MLLSSPLIQKEVDSELDRLVGQEGTIHTKMLALQRMGYTVQITAVSNSPNDHHLFELSYIHCI